MIFLNPQLINKYAKENEELSLNQKFSLQREKLERFYHAFATHLNAIINEMDGDIFVLRTLQLDPKSLEVLKKLRLHLIEKVKHIDPTQPYSGVIKLIEWASQKEIKSIISNLQFIIAQYLAHAQENILFTKHIQPARVESLKKLLPLMDEAKNYIELNPLLPDPRFPSEPPSSLYSVKEDGFASIKRDDITAVRIPNKEKNF